MAILPFLYMYCIYKYIELNVAIKQFKNNQFNLRLFDAKMTINPGRCSWPKLSNRLDFEVGCVASNQLLLNYSFGCCEDATYIIVCLLQLHS